MNLTSSTPHHGYHLQIEMITLNFFHSRYDFWMCLTNFIKHFHIQQLLRKSCSILPLVYISNSSINPIEQTSQLLAIASLQGQQRSHIRRILISHTKF